DDSSESAQDEQFANAKEAVLGHVRFGRECLAAAQVAFGDGDLEGAWWWLVQAGTQAGSGQTALYGAWIRPAIDPKVEGRKGGLGRRDLFRARRAAAVQMFMKAPHSWRTQTEAIRALQDAMESNSLSTSDAARTKLYADHPQVKRLIATLPLKAMRTRR